MFLYTFECTNRNNYLFKCVNFNIMTIIIIKINDLTQFLTDHVISVRSQDSVDLNGYDIKNLLLPDWGVEVLYEYLILKNSWLRWIGTYLFKFFRIFSSVK